MLVYSTTFIGYALPGDAMIGVSHVERHLLKGYTLLVFHFASAVCETEL